MSGILEREWEEKALHVEVDDPDGDWTTAGVFEVDAGVYRMPLPLPHSGLSAVNVYAVAAQDGLVLIDSGWGIEADRDALDKAIACLGRDISDVRRFLVTHVHRDHYGMAVALRREYGITVSLGEGERPAIEALNNSAHLPLSEHITTMIRSGAGELAAVMRERMLSATSRSGPLGAARRVARRRARGGRGRPDASSGGHPWTHPRARGVPGRGGRAALRR